MPPGRKRGEEGKKRQGVHKYSYSQAAARFECDCLSALLASSRIFAAASRYVEWARSYYIVYSCIMLQGSTVSALLPDDFRVLSAHHHIVGGPSAKLVVVLRLAVHDKPRGTFSSVSGGNRGIPFS